MPQRRVDILINARDNASGTFAKVAGGLAAYFSIRVISSYTSGIVDLGDEIGKLSKRLATTTDEYQALTFAARRQGASSNDIEKGFKRMTSVVLDAENGLADANRALNAVGLTWQQLKGKSPEEQFAIMAERLNALRDESAKLAVAQDLFGARAGAALIPVVAEYQSLKDELREIGGIIESKNVAAAERFKDSMENINTTIKATIANSGLLGWLDKIAGHMQLLINMRGVMAAGAQAGNVQEFGREFRSLQRQNKNATPRELEDLARTAYGEVTNKYVKFGEIPKEFRSQLPAAMGDSMQDAEKKHKERAAADAAAANFKSEKKAAELAKKTAASAEKRSSAVKKSIELLKERAQVQNLINGGKEREAFIQEQINAAARAGSISEKERKDIVNSAGSLFDARQKKNQPQGQGQGPAEAFVTRFLSGLGSTNRPMEQTAKATELTAKNTSRQIDLLAELNSVIKNLPGTRLTDAIF